MYIFVMGKDFIIAPWHATSHVSLFRPSRFMLWIFTTRAMSSQHGRQTHELSTATCSDLTKICVDSLFQECGKERWLCFLPTQTAQFSCVVVLFLRRELVELTITYTMYFHRYQDIFIALAKLRAWVHYNNIVRVHYNKRVDIRTYTSESTGWNRTVFGVDMLLFMPNLPAKN